MTECCMVLIAGNVKGATSSAPAQSRRGSAVARVKVGSGTTRGDLSGSVKDIESWERIARTHHVLSKWRNITSFKKPGEMLKKIEVVAALKKAFSQTRNGPGRDDFDAGQCVVVWCGHGRGEEGHWGDWCFEDEYGNICEYLSYEEVLQLWQRHRTDKECRLTIVADCCHSGGWLDKLQSGVGLIPRVHFDTSCPGDGVDIRAACLSDQLAHESDAGGYFTGHLMRTLHVGDSYSYTDAMRDRDLRKDELGRVLQFATGGCYDDHRRGVAFGLGNTC